MIVRKVTMNCRMSKPVDKNKSGQKLSDQNQYTLVHGYHG